MLLFALNYHYSTWHSQGMKMCLGNTHHSHLCEFENVYVVFRLPILGIFYGNLSPAGMEPALDRALYVCTVVKIKLVFIKLAVVGSSTQTHKEDVTMVNNKNHVSIPLTLLRVNRKPKQHPCNDNK